VLELTNLNKTYDPTGANVQALRDVSLSIGAGQFIAVCGPSGCGKSTLLLTAGGLARPDGGSVRFEGRDVYAMTPAKRAAYRASNIGFVFQQFHLVPYLSVLDNVLAASLGLRDGGDKAQSRAIELLEQFGMSHRLDHTPAKLSTGERQRTALARALLNQPPLILADEPTGNLDNENAIVVLDVLSSFVDKGGAVMLVTHDEQAAARASLRVTMSQGKMIEPEHATL
jgi:putative ABC transport system ATP-binding protein